MKFSTRRQSKESSCHNSHLLTRDTEGSLGLNWVHIFVMGSTVRVDERADSLELVKRKRSG